MPAERIAASSQVGLLCARFCIRMKLLGGLAHRALQWWVRSIEVRNDCKHVCLCCWLGRIRIKVQFEMESAWSLSAGNSCCSRASEQRQGSGWCTPIAAETKTGPTWDLSSQTRPDVFYSSITSSGSWLWRQTWKTMSVHYMPADSWLAYTTVRYMQVFCWSWYYKKTLYA